MYVLNTDEQSKKRSVEKEIFCPEEILTRKVG
jgi:hypothetical protein